MAKNNPKAYKKGEKYLYGNKSRARVDAEATLTAERKKPSSIGGTYTYDKDGNRVLESVADNAVGSTRISSKWDAFTRTGYYYGKRKEEQDKIEAKFMKPEAKTENNTKKYEDSGVPYYSESKFKRPIPAVSTMRRNKDGNLETESIGRNAVGSTHIASPSDSYLSTMYYLNERKREQDITQTKAEIETILKNRKGIKKIKK